MSLTNSTIKRIPVLRSSRILIVDDEPLAIKVIENYLQKFNNYEVAATCQNILEVLNMNIFEKEKISAETSFVNDLGADSLDTVELVMELEEEFNISIRDK